MPPKKPTLSLRQPPPANMITDLEAADRFVRGESAAMPVAGATALRVAEPEAPMEPSSEVAAAVPPAIVKLVEIPAGDAVPSFRRADKSISVRKRDGAIVRRTTIYFDLELAKKLAAHCHAEQQDVSEVVGLAVKEFLAKA